MNLALPSESTLLLSILGFGVVCIAIVLALRSAPATVGAGKALTPLLVSEIVILALALVPLAIGGVVLASSLGLLACRCGYEAAIAMRAGGDRQDSIAIQIGAAVGLSVVAAFVLEPRWLAFVLTIAVTAIACLWLQSGGRPASLCAFLAFPGATLVAFSLTAGLPYGLGVLALAFLFVEIFDSAALLGGKLIGHTPAFPRLSPRKTLEGLAVGGVVLIGSALFVGLVLTEWSLVQCIAVAIAVMGAAIFGDLVASAIKRRAGVKDYPPVHSVQGGALDVVDAWIVTAPALALIVG